MDALSAMRGKNYATVKDLVSLRKALKTELAEQTKMLQRLHEAARDPINRSNTRRKSMANLWDAGSVAGAAISLTKIGATNSRPSRLGGDSRRGSCMDFGTGTASGVLGSNSVAGSRRQSCVSR